MSINEQILEKLRKILALANGKGATEAEMKLAMAKANALAMEHNIDLSSVDVDGEVKVGAIETDRAETHTKTTQERPYHMFIIWTIQAVFDVKPILSTHYNNQCMRIISRITWVGEKTDLAMAVYCWAWLEGLFPKCWLEYRKANGAPDSYVSSRSYYAGLYTGLVENNQRAKESMPADLANRYALVVANKSAIVQAKVDELFPPSGLKPVRTIRNSEDRAALHAGYDKGRSIKLNGGLTAGPSNVPIR